MATNKRKAPSTVIVDKVIGEGEHAIKVFADLQYLMTDFNDYLAKILDARHIPVDTEELLPNDPMITIASLDPTIAAMPETTKADQEAKRRAIGQAVMSFYRQQSEIARSDAMMLALTMENDFTDPPIPYDEEDYVAPVRKRPGLVSFPTIRRDLGNPVEMRLKQLYDRLIANDGMFTELQELTQYLAVDVNRRLQQIDKDGFRG